MDLNWVVLFMEVESRKRRIRHDPFADPLEQPEWCGLHWAVLIIARLVARRSAAAEAARRKEEKTGESLRFRSSAAARDAGIPG
ncbi:hypothetical protein FHS26_003322 [Rhizobium pisi]|uniref:Uncharacterized protein n=1 Tax=Rhizobium pisi TaxID=574561 RepID=A0A427MYS8_9HYPH|nr:hypothetical protein [Rhizobium pisi]MBB3135576.1 hypothetical protein [Rhizobium pisi]RSB76283.1 hypothetical protein EFD55_16665 [Rhizobium pisi]TCA58890.1 hypothetical protein E0J16_11030 [Rhizobium pisi]